MSKLFADLDHRVRPLRWHYETRLLRWGGHIVRMEKDRLPRMLMTSWVPNSRPIGCPRMTFGRTVKKALKRLPGIWPNLPFDRPDNWDSLMLQSTGQITELSAQWTAAGQSILTCWAALQPRQLCPAHRGFTPPVPCLNRNVILPRKYVVAHISNTYLRCTSNQPAQKFILFPLFRNLPKEKENIR